jgi:hypothetical protein
LGEVRKRTEKHGKAATFRSWKKFVATSKWLITPTPQPQAHHGRCLNGQLLTSGTLLISLLDL